MNSSALQTSSLPFVSVCLLTYKRAHMLSATIESILRQTHGYFELIINDNNSPDHTAEVARNYAHRDPRVRYCRNETNLGYAGNQNAAITRAAADYVAILHDGDIYRADLLEKWTRALCQQPSAALVFNALEKMDLDGKVTHVYRHPYGPLIRGRDLLTEMLARPDSPIFGIVMVRRSCVKSVGPFRLALPWLADVDMWMRLLARYDAAYVAEPLIKVAAHEKDHPIRIGNWRIRQEHELIYALNLPKAFPEIATAEARRARGRTVRMLWGQRLFWLAWCLRHGRFKSLFEGLTYCFTRPSVLDTSIVSTS